MRRRDALGQGKARDTIEAKLGDLILDDQLKVRSPERAQYIITFQLDRQTRSDLSTEPMRSPDGATLHMRRHLKTGNQLLIESIAGLFTTQKC